MKDNKILANLQRLILKLRIETLKIREQKNLVTPIYISPISYGVASECLPSNCSCCDPLILQHFNLYNRSRSVSVFNDCQCTCKRLWQKELEKSNSLSLTNCYNI